MDGENPNLVEFVLPLPSGATVTVVLTGVQNSDLPDVPTQLLTIPPRLPGIFPPSA